MMYTCFGNLLACLGLRFPRKINIEKYFQDGHLTIDPDEAVMDDDLEPILDIECIRIPKFTDCCQHYKQILFWFYSVFIFCLICVEPCFLLYKTIELRDLKFVSNVAFMIIAPIQHIIAVKYFRSKSFDKIYFEVSVLHDTKHPIKNDRQLSWLILIPSLISIVISSVFTLVSNDESTIFNLVKDDLNITQKVFLFLFQIIYWIYSRTILFLVLSVFFYVFIKHLNNIKTLIFTVKNNNVWVEDQTIISEFIHAIIKLRHELNDSILKLSDIYTFSTILGAIAVGNVIHFKKTDSFTLISCIIFAICQVIFLLIIHLVSDQQRQLGGIIRNPQFSMKYIYRKYRSIDLNLSPDSKTPVLYQTLDNLDSISYISTGRLLKNFHVKSIKSKTGAKPYTLKDEIIETDNNGEVIQLGTLDDIQNEDDNEVDLEKGIKVIDSAEKRVRVRSRSRSRSRSRTRKKKDVCGVSPVTKNIIKKINQISNYNGSSIDYIILHLLIEDNWTTNFDLLGMKFDNSNALKKAILITGMIVTASSFLSELQVRL